MSWIWLLEVACRAVVVTGAGLLVLRLLRPRHPDGELAALRLLVVGTLLLPPVLWFGGLPIALPSVQVPGAVARHVPPALGQARGALEQALAVVVGDPARPATSGGEWRGIFRPGVLAVLLWACVAALLLARHAAGVLLAMTHWSRARRVPRHRVGGHAVRASEATAVPVTLGFGILLPHDWDAWDEVTLERVLIHEAEHVRRGDFFWQLLTGVHCSLFWFNPFAWRIHDRSIELAEAWSDAAVLAQRPDRPSYAELLLYFGSRSGRVSPGVAMSRSAQLGRRIESILNEEGDMTSSSRVRRSTTLAAIALLLTLSAGATIVSGTGARGRGGATGGGARSGSGAGSSSGGFAYHTTRDPEGISFIYSGDPSSGHVTMSGSLEDYDRALKFREEIEGPYVWFRADGKEYVLTDGDVLDRIAALFADAGHGPDPADALEAEMDALQAEMDGLQSEMDQLAERLSSRSGESEAAAREMQAVAKLMEEMAALQADLGRQQAIRGEEQAREAEAASRAAVELLRKSLSDGVARPLR